MAKLPPPSTSADRDAGTLRGLVERYYGGGCEILALRRSSISRACLFVVDAMERGRPVRTLGTIGSGGAVMEQSAMDLLRPERLVFAYERMMLLAFALAKEPASALLLGLGGGAMCRHLAAYLPDVAVTVVERDPAVIALARSHFRIAREIVEADAQDFVADARGRFDVVLADLYDAGGATALDEPFWRDCLGALRPGGCVAINWAGSRGAGPRKEDIARAGAQLGRSFLLTEHGRQPNVVQFAPTDPGFDLAALEARARDFARRRRLPREDRDILRRTTPSSSYPVRRRGAKL